MSWLAAGVILTVLGLVGSVVMMAAPVGSRLDRLGLSAALWFTPFGVAITFLVEAKR